MKLKSFFKKVIFNIEAKIWRYRKRILFSLIDTEISIKVHDKPDGKKFIVVQDVITSKLLAELELVTYYKKPINNVTRYWVERYKAYK